MSALRWSETMRGRVAFGADDYNQGWWSGSACSFSLDVDCDDVERFVADPEHTATATGVIDCPALGGRLEIAEGTFNLLVHAGGSRRREMRYRLLARDPDGRPVTLEGVKVVQDDPFRDTWSDTTTLFTRLRAGWVREGERPPEAPMACGILRISPAGLVRMTLGMRGPLRAKLRFGRLFCGSLLGVYLGPRTRAGQPDFPGEGARPGPAWEPVPGRPGLRRHVVGVRTADGVDLTVHRLARDGREPQGDPVLMMHGTGTRAEIFYGAPLPRTLPEALLDAGLDVWVANWRGSIDLPARSYTLDEVARYDHPALIAAVLRETGRATLKAVVHCQGSTSFALAAAAGLVPEVTDVVSTSVSFHVDVPAASRRRMTLLLPLLAPGYPGFDPQWAIRPTAARARVLALYTRLVRRECHQPVCQMANYVYGAGGDVLWAHRNIEPATHRWIAREFGWVPTSFFRQMARCVRAGQVVAVDGSTALPARAADAPPRDRPRWTLIAGSDNRCFLPSSQQRTFAWLDDLEPGRHALHVIGGYTHLDLYFGVRAGEDVFGHVVTALGGGTSAPTAR
ncbi:MAG: alpha/beta fold hydrolase [Solirubrobacteraceae bacterium]